MVVAEEVGCGGPGGFIGEVAEDPLLTVGRCAAVLKTTPPEALPADCDLIDPLVAIIHIVYRN